MRTLITGNLGYIGPVVVEHLRKQFPQIFLAGFDIGYFAACRTPARGRDPESYLDVQYYGDIRTIKPDMLRGIQNIVHLAAISNDPMGNQFEQLTTDINYTATVRLAEMAKAAGVRRFVFASSCSVYGYAEDGPRNEKSALDPLTAYARSKVKAEQDLCTLASDRFSVTCLRFATACGFSPRTRLDLVLNDFVANALVTNSITILSDGSPWRPLIHVKDMAKAVEWALDRPIDQPYTVVNTGSSKWNFQVRSLAEAVAAQGEDVNIYRNLSAKPDKRSYQVNFDLYQALAPNHQPSITLPEAIDELALGLEISGFSYQRHDSGAVRNSNLIRLGTLQTHLAAGRLNPDLTWA